jgi:hypothetical protein
MGNAWQYSGDINLKCGGLFWRLPDGETWESSDYADSVEVIDINGATGGPENEFLIEFGSIFLGADLVARSLDCIGAKLETCDGVAGINDNGDFHPMDSQGAYFAKVYAVRAYAGQDGASRYIVRIGKDERHDSSPSLGDVDTVLHGNAKLSNYVQSEHLHGQKFDWGK